MKAVLFYATASLALLFGSLQAVNAQCESDQTIYLTDFTFTPSALTISVGESVAFINAQGTHNVDGTSENNPEPFFLEETDGNINGVCMGVVTFNTPGTYEFTSSIGVQAELGMVGTITVDAVTLTDQLLNLQNGETDLSFLQSWQSSYALNAYFSATWNGVENTGWAGDVDLNGAESYTVFVPTDQAIGEVMELINLNQFDLLSFYDMPAALKYHIVPGVYLAEDLTDGLSLATAEGQSLTISIGDQGAMVDDANITYTNITAYNGVIHIIDKILAPSGYPGATVLNVIMQSEEHTLFEQAIFNEGLDDDLRGQPILNDNEDASGPFTVFAPTDEALITFAAQNGFEDVYALLASQDMDNIVNQHIVESVYESIDLFSGLQLQAYNNEILSVNIASDGTTVNGALIAQPDLLAYNGVVHSMGELIPYDFPVVEGTCGSWTVHMIAVENSNYEPWNGAELDIYSNGTLIATESPNSFGVESFSFPADVNSTINVVYRGYSGSNYNDYEIVDESGFVIFSSASNQSNGGLPMSVYGLKPCEETPSTCGPIEIVFTDESQDGWFGGGMFIVSGQDPVATILFNQTYYPFSSLPVLVYVDSGELDFIVNQPYAFADYCGYIIKDPQGNVLVNETSTFVPPPSTLGLEICEAATSDVQDGMQAPSAVSLYPNPANGFVTISGINPDQRWEASLVSLDGKLVGAYNGMGSTPLTFRDLAPGMYSMRILLDDGQTHSIQLIQE